MFKGSGFYQTDYRSEAYKKRASEDQKPAETSTSSSETKTDTASKGNSAETKSSDGRSSKKKP